MIVDNWCRGFHKDGEIPTESTPILFRISPIPSKCANRTNSDSEDWQFSGKNAILAIATTVSMRNFLPTLLFVLLSAVRVSAAQELPYAYIPKSVESGLSQPNVTSLLLDGRGSLWIGTRNGLNRFDRQEITVYTSHGHDAARLPGNDIKGLSETQDGSVWIRTSHGIARYRPWQDGFETVLEKPFYSSLVVSDGILFGGDGSLTRFTGDGAPEYLYPFGEGPSAGDPAYRIDRMVALEGNEILLGTEEKGLFRYEPGRPAVPFRQDAQRQVVALYRSQAGEIFVAYDGDGVRRYSQDGTELAHYTTRNSGLAHDYVQDFAEYDGSLWIATDGGGISLADLSTGTFRTLRYSPDDPGCLPSNSVTVLYPDPSGALWAGTVKHGFFQVRQNYIRSFSGPLYGLTDNAVISLYREEDGTLWVGTDGGGIHRFDPAAGRFTPLPGTRGKILSLVGFDARHLLASVYMEGFFLVDKVTGARNPFTLVNEEVNRLECFWGYLPRVARVAGDKLYFLSYSPWQYDLRTRSFSLMQVEDGLTVSGIRLACSDEREAFFYQDNQVLCADLNEGRIRRLFSVGEQEKVTSVAFDGDRTVWVGTDRGLGKYDRRSGIYEPMQTGLFDSVSALEYAGNRQLWICARNRLLTYLCDADRFVSWSASDGFRPNDIKMLYQNAVSPDYIYMGGSDGLVQVSRAIPIPGPEPVSVFLDQLTVNGRPALSDMEGNRIRVPWNYQSLVASFLVKDSDAFQRKYFRYTVVGAQTRTFESDDARLALPALSTGTYRILVSCLQKGGDFTEPESLLEVTVLPPWYKAHWFHLLLVSALLAAAIWGIRALSRRQEHENKSSMAHFLEEMLQETEEPEEGATVTPDPEFKDRLDAVILQHLSDSDLDVQFLTEQLAMSRTLLYGKVKQVTGLGVKDYINRVRIERSVDLLLHTDKNINEIAYEVGFAYPRYFSTSFKNMKGVTPTRFKQENRSSTPDTKL